MRFLLFALSLIVAGAAHAQTPGPVPVSVPDTILYAEPGTVAGTPVSIPVYVGADVTDRGIQSADIVVRYNAAVLTVTSVTVSDLVPSGCSRVTNVRDAAEGGFKEAVATVACSSSTPFAGGPGPLVTLGGALVGGERTDLTLVDETPFNEGNVAAEVTSGVLRVVTDPDPAIGEIGAVTIEEDGTARVEIALSDADTPLEDLTVTAASGNTGVVASDGIAVGACENDDAACRALTITPLPDATGTATITVTVTDSDDRSDDASRTFDLTVTPVNDAPTVASPLADQSVRVGEAAEPVSLAAAFADVDGDALVYTAVSSDPETAAVSVENGTLTVTPVAEGDATVTVTAADPDGLEASDSFAVDVMRGVSTTPDPGAPVFALRGVYPNPSAGTARVALDLPAAAEVRVEVFDVVGRRVLGAAGSLPAGAARSLPLNADVLPPGVYVCRVVAETGGAQEVAVGRLTIVD
jgi:hypothetical protein